VLNNFAFVLTGIFSLKNKYYMMVRVMLIVLLADVEVLKKTWQGLLDYRAEFKKKNQKRSGDGAASTSGKWPFYDAMSFLDVCPKRE